jgi:hypothetical protein
MKYVKKLVLSWYHNLIFRYKGINDDVSNIDIDKQASTTNFTLKKIVWITNMILYPLKLKKGKVSTCC